MVAPSLRALGTVTSATTAAPSFAAPAGAVASDVILVGAFINDGRTVITAPAGFASAPSAPQVSAAGGAPDHILAVYWGRFSDVGAGPYAFALSGSQFVEGRTVAIQGCITTGSPWDAANGATSGTTSQTVAPLVTATSTGANRYGFYVATNWNGGAWTPSTGFTTQWNANTRVCTFDDITLPTAQTVTPQATCAVSGLENAWVGILLPIPEAPVANQPGTVVYGKKTNPQANDIIVTSGPLIAGRYRVNVIAKPNTAIAASDSDNVQLTNSGTAVCTLMMSGTGRLTASAPEMVLDVAAGGSISVTAVANASGVGVTYGAILSVRPEAMYL